MRHLHGNGRKSDQWVDQRSRGGCRKYPKMVPLRQTEAQPLEQEAVVPPPACQPGDTGAHFQTQILPRAAAIASDDLGLPSVVEHPDAQVRLSPRSLPASEFVGQSQRRRIGGTFQDRQVQIRCTRDPRDLLIRKRVQVRAQSPEAEVIAFVNLHQRRETRLARIQMDRQWSFQNHAPECTVLEAPDNTEPLPVSGQIAEIGEGWSARDTSPHFC